MSMSRRTDRQSQFATLTRVHGVSFDSLAVFIRHTLKNEFKFRRLKIFNQHPKDPMLLRPQHMEIIPTFCHLAASALIREFRINKNDGDDFENYQMEIWKGDFEYNFTLINKLGKEAAGKY